MRTTMPEASTPNPAKPMEHRQRWALIAVASVGALLGGFFLPFAAPTVAADAARLCLLASVQLTGHLDIGPVRFEVHTLAAIVSGLFALAVWELYHCIRPRDRERSAEIILRIAGHPRPLASILFGGFLLNLILNYSVPSPPPADEPLLLNFNRNVAALEQVRQSLATAPALHTVRIDNPDGSEPEGSPPTLPADRSALYLGQLQTAGIASARIRDEKTILSAWTESGMHGNREKGYLYTTLPPAPLLPSLDSRQPDANNAVFRRISGNWYLFSWRSQETRP